MAIDVFAFWLGKFVCLMLPKHFFGIRLATIILDRDECDEGFLPSVCVRCGESATGVVVQTFRWFHPALFLLIFVCLPLYLILGIVLRKQMKVTLPTCDAHRSIWIRRQVMMMLGVFAMIVGVITGLTFGHDFDRRYYWSGGFMIFFGLGFAIGIVLIAIGNLLAVRPTRITRNEITLKGVSPVFTETVEQYRILLEDDED